MESAKWKFNCIPLDVYAELRDYCKEHNHQINHTPIKNNKNYLNCTITIKADNLPDLFTKTKEFKGWYPLNAWLRNCVQF